MSARRVVVVSGDPAPVQGRAAGEAWRWLYFGRSAERYAAWRAAVGSWSEPLDSAALVNDAVEKFGDELLDFDEVLAYRTPLRWHSSDLAERDPYNSTFLFRCAAALAFENVLDSLEANLVVAVDGDWLLARKLARRATASGLAGQLVGGPRGPLPLVRYRLSSLLRGIKARQTFLATFFRNRRRLARARRRFALSTDLDTLIVTWAQPHSFAPGRPIEREAFSGDLPALLRARGRRIGFVACPMSWAYTFDEILANVRSAQDDIVLLEECVRIRDALWICAQTLGRPARRVRRYVVAGVDLSDLLDDALRPEAPCWVLQFFCVGKALARRRIRPDLIIHPFENQSWEKALRLGVRRSLPEARVVGYQHSTVHFGPSSNYPSRRDLSERALPDTIVVNGRLWERVLLEHGYPAERLRSGPALRFTHVLARLESPPPGESLRGQRDPTVLVAGAGDYDESLEFVCKAVEALGGRASIGLVIKLHPTMPAQDRFPQAVARVLGIDALPSNVEFVTRSIAELLPSVDLLLHTKTATAYEALAYGLPVVYVRTDFWLDRNPLPPGSDIGFTARSPEEIRAVVRSALAESGAALRERRARARDLLTSAFTPVTDEALRPFVEPQ